MGGRWIPIFEAKTRHQPLAGRDSRRQQERWLDKVSPGAFVRRRMMRFAASTARYVPDHTKSARKAVDDASSLSYMRRGIFHHCNPLIAGRRRARRAAITMTSPRAPAARGARRATHTTNQHPHLATRNAHTTTTNATDRPECRPHNHRWEGLRWCFMSPAGSVGSRQGAGPQRPAPPPLTQPFPLSPTQRGGR